MTRKKTLFFLIVALLIGVGARALQADIAPADMADDGTDSICVQDSTGGVSLLSDNSAGWDQFLPMPVVPPTPTSAVYSKYDAESPSLSTGAVSLSVPFYTIDYKGVSLPIALKYMSNGIKVFDSPYPCGYGWSVHPALRITRTMHGRPDELFPSATREDFSQAGSHTKEEYDLARMCMLDGSSAPIVSDYLDCAGNPVNLVDPTGEDIIDLDIFGNIINYTHSDGTNVFRVLEDGQVVAEHETDEEMSGNSANRDAGIDNVKCDFYFFKNNYGTSESEKLFEFLAINTVVEWSLVAIETTGQNIITTSHLMRKEFGLNKIFSALKKSFGERKIDIYSITHCHTADTKIPSGNKDSKVIDNNGDYGVKRKFLEHFNVTRFRLYIPGENIYIDY